MPVTLGDTRNADSYVRKGTGPFEDVSLNPFIRESFRFPMKNLILISFTALTFLVLPTTTISAGNLLCATCGKGIVGSYQQFKGKPYCSDACLKDALPVCVVCGKPSPKYIRVTGDIEKIYCSQECLQTTLLKCEICGRTLKQWVKVENHNYCSNCSRLPACLNCRLPGAEKRLPDGRPICLKCIKTVIIDEGHARKICQDVRNDIYTYLNLKTDHFIEFYLKDDAGLTALMGGKRRATEEGYYGFDEKYRMRRGAKSIVSGTYTIYVLSALSLPNFRNTVAHELTHDLGHTLYPAVQKQEDVEGFAEYISSLMNRYWGNDNLNREKLQNREKAYADAYKKFLKIGEKNGLTDVLDYMAKQNRKTRAE